MQSYDNEITSLFKVMDRVRKTWRSFSPCKELSKSQFGTLMAISHCHCQNDQTITLTKLASLMHQSNPALSQRIKTLEELGYVERVASDNDRRINGVRLTSSGQSILDIAHTQFKAIITDVIDKLGIEETTALITSLNKLADAFDEAIISSAYKGETYEKN